jgi:SOS response regulatory protein OraA/RecX
VTVRLEGEPDLGRAGASPEPEADWHDEVDALIEQASRPHADIGAGSETVVTVHEDTLVALRLLKGRQLTAEEWESLRHEEAREDAYRAALAILERKARTSRELSQALKRKGYSADIVRSCIDRLQSRRMLDDSAYARRYAEQKATAQRKGRRLIRQELLQRGIAKEEADRALNALDAGAEQEAADALACKKWPQTKGEKRERKMKLAAFLLRRGFPNRVVRSAVDRAVAEADDAADFAEPSDDF